MKKMSALTSSRRHVPRLFYAGTALLIAVLLATTLAVILNLRDSEMAVEENQLSNLSLTLAEQADRSFHSVDLMISSVAAEVAAEGLTDGAAFERAMSGHDVHLRLQEKLSGFLQLDAVTVIGGDGKLINFSRAWPAPATDVSDRDYFRAMKADPSLRIYVSAPVRNRATGTWTIFLARRVSGARGELLGLILGAIKMRYFAEFYGALSLGETGSIAIARTDGVVLVRVPDTDATGKTFSASQRFIQGGDSGLLHEVSPIDGKMRIKAAHLLANYPLFILTTKTEDAALIRWRAIAGPMSLGAVGGSFAIAIAAFLFGRQWKQQSMLAEARSELRRQEDLIDAMTIRKEAAELADRSKSEFLATMSHELRTPLNAVIGFSEIMFTELYGPLGSDRYRDYARDIHASGSHLLDIIDDVLDLSKAAAGKMVLDATWIDARDAINSVSRLIRHRVAEAQLSLTVNLPPGSLTIYADQRLFKQMLINLFSNACKFTPPGGNIDCSVSISSAGLTFAVTDTGIGIPAADLERVAEPFVQVDSSLSRRHQGTGLGLALVKTMAELHGGSLRLESTVGRGTTATVFLPGKDVAPAIADLAPESGSSDPALERLSA
jgi:signal transduction histidine kinase